MKDEKLVIFDWGGVIESHREGEHNIDIAKTNIIKRFNPSLSDNEILIRYNNCDGSSINNHINTVNTIEKVKEWFERIKTSTEIDCTFEEFCEVYEEEYMKVFYYKDVVEYIHSLKDKCRIGILSNLCYLDKKRIDMQTDLKQFDYVWLSFELKYRKPDNKIYEIVENTCNTKPENILFIDDKKINIDTAKQRGWNTHQAFGYELDTIKIAVNEFLAK